ncbi:filamentous hemagglutinin N-terminal domain-containing protein, partial [bacterium]|nr:filamentous hemagglutinin N-terminal domain-containing protein [bacterium]
IALNRVTGDQLSLIDGSLLANGQVWLLNPNGVFIGQGGQISSRGFLGTTSSIGNDDFMAGSYNFTRSAKPGGAVVNQGQITALRGGYAVLAGDAVRNQGVVSAELGQVVLAGGRAFAMDLQGDRLISFQVTAPVETLAADGKAVVLNTGALIANGGRVTLTAKAAEDVVTSVINTGGLIQATSVRNVNGKIVLEGDTGNVTVAGTLDVSGKNPGETGGAIKIFGRNLEFATASLDATGDAGGGSIYVGGGWQGASIDGRLAALTTRISADSILNASALTSGNGGTIVAWSNVNNPLSSTTVAGTLLAQGGATQGNGGNIETSGHHLDVNGIAVNAGATNGSAGNWLLDPYDITIVASGGSGGLGGGSFTSDSSATSIDAAAIQTGLSTTNVTIQTGGTTGDNNGNGDIKVNSALAWSTANTLSLIAHGGVSGDSAITIGTGGGLVINQAGNSTYSGTIGGDGSLTKAGTGTLTLTGENHYSGNTTISAGTLSLKVTDSAPGPTTSGTYFIASGATLNLDVEAAGKDFIYRSAPNTPLPVEFQGEGTISKTGSGTAVWGDGAATFALGSGGLIDVKAGTFVGGSYGDENWTNNLASLHVAAGAIFDGVEAAVRIDALTGSGILSSGYYGEGSITVGVNNFRAGTYNAADVATFEGTIQDTNGSPGSLIKTGSGKLTLSGTNTYTGTTTVDAGTLTFANRQSLYNSNVDSMTTDRWTADFITVKAGATLALAVGNSTDATPS